MIEGAPTVTSISPTAGPVAGGTALTITGANLTGANAVDYGPTAATSFTVVSSTELELAVRWAYAPIASSRNKLVHYPTAAQNVRPDDLPSSPWPRPSRRSVVPRGRNEDEARSRWWSMV